MSMKFGLIVHHTTKNIGDDIQSLATSYFLPQIDYIINRERLDTFVSNDKESVAALMPGWYLWNKWNWPPSEYIIPKFISFHYSNRTIGRRTDEPFEDLFLSGIGKDYMNAHGPIGARDYYTQNWLERLDIKTYFSSCITTTLPNMPSTNDKNRYICLVDVENSNVEKAVHAVSSDIQIKKITHKVADKHFKAKWPKRKKVAEMLLTTYQNARCVVTTRLHCSLPCLAMGVPVLLIHPDEKGHRFIPYYDWLHTATPDEFLSGKSGFDLLNPPPNKDLHIPYRESLIATAKEFIAEISTPDYIEKYKKNYSNQDFITWRHDLMKETLKNWGTQRRNEYSEIAKLNRMLSKQ